MKVRANFQKNDVGTIIATLTVIDKGDYPTRYIFQNSNDLPTKSFKLAESEEDYIVGKFASAELALVWAKSQIDALEALLTDWRNISVPEPFEDEF